MSTTEEKPTTLNGILLEEEKDVEMRKALEFIGEAQVRLDAKDMASAPGGTEDVIMPGKDAQDFSDIQLTAEEEKMEVSMAPVKVTTAIEEDSMDFDAPEQPRSGPVEIDQGTLSNLTRIINGQRLLRHSELYLLARGKIEETVPQQPSTTFNVVAQRLVQGTDDTVVFNKLPGGASLDETAHPDVEDEEEALELPKWNPDSYAYPLVVPKKATYDFVDNFQLSPSEAEQIRRKFRLQRLLAESFNQPSDDEVDRDSPSSMQVDQIIVAPVINGNAVDVTYNDEFSSSSHETAVLASKTIRLPRKLAPLSVKADSPTESEDFDIDDDKDTLPDIDSLVHPVQHVPWELDIIWDEAEPEIVVPSVAAVGGDEEANITDGNASDSESVSSADTQDPTRARDRELEIVSTQNVESELVESVFRPPRALQLPESVQLRDLVSHAHVYTGDADDESEELSARKERDVVVIGSKVMASHFPAYNRKLDESDWMDRVVWDDSDLNQLERLAPNGVRVEVYMSDVHILFEEEGAHMMDDDEEDKEGDASSTTGPLGKKQIRKRHLQLKAKSTDLHRSKLDALSQIDKFNLSRDAYYMDGLQAKAREKKSVKLLHSHYALSHILLRKCLSKMQYIHFHRPKLHMFIGIPQGIYPTSRLGVRKKSRGLEVMKHRRDLSAREGRIVLFEYSEEFPPALHDIGMASRIANYKRKESRDNEVAPHLAFLDQGSVNRPDAVAQNVVTDDALPHEDGEEIILDRTLDLPFLGDIQAGAQIQAVHNNLFRAPIFRHLPEESDFLLIRLHAGVDTSIPFRKGAHNHYNAQQQETLSSFYVREIPALYLVGQQEPEQVVPTPGSRTDNEYVKTRLEQFVYYLLSLSRKSTGRAEVKLSSVADYFPRTETATRKVLRKFTSFDRSGEGTWTFTPTDARPTLPTDAEIEAMTSLDDSCLFDCQQAVMYRLKGLGVPVSDIANIHRHVKTLHERQDPRFQIARFIAEELELAAWNLTSNFIDSAHSKSILQLRGLGDPSGCGQAYSYLRLPMKIANLKKDKEKEAGVVVTGTESDLRSLTLPQLNALLRQEGVSEQRIAEMKRWPKVHLLRDIANNRKKQEAEDSTDINKFARYSKHNVATHQDQYNDRIQQIFSSQIQALKYNPNPEEEEVGDLADMIGLDSGFSMEASSTPESALEAKIQEETQAYLRFVNSLETTKSGEEESLSTSATRPGTPTPSGSGTTTVTRIDDEAIVLDPVTGLPTKPGKYAKITSTNSAGVERVTWSLDPHKVAQAKEASAITAKATATAAKRAAKSSASRRKNGDGAKQTKCGRCGQTGHNRNSSACPMYSDMIDDDEDGYGGKKKKKGAPKSKRPKSDTEEEEEEILEEDWVDDGDETPEEDFADDVGIAAQRNAGQTRAEVVAAGGTKFVFKGLGGNANRRRAAAKRKRSDFIDFGDDEDDDDFNAYAVSEQSPPKKRVSKPRVKADSPQGELNSLLRPSLDAVINLPEFYLFRAKVDKQDLPDYYTVIKQPMYMDLIASRLRTYSYTSVAAYLADWNLIKTNCYTYNHITSPTLLPIVDDLVIRVHSYISSIGEDRIQLLESAVKQAAAEASSAPGAVTPVSTPTPASVNVKSNHADDHDPELDIM